MTRSSNSLPTIGPVEREGRAPQKIDRKAVVEINRRSNKQKLRDAAKKGLSK